jgi:hypothetical protein
MPAHKTGRGRRSGAAQFVTSSLTGGTVTKRFSNTAGHRFAEKLKNRPNRLLPPHARSRLYGYQVERVDDYIPNFPEPNQFDLGDEYGTECWPVQSLWNTKSRRSKAAERQATALNWRLAENRMVDMYFGENLQCNCRWKQSVKVRFISCEHYTLRNVRYCSCGLASSSLFKQGFFPSTPVKPRTVFSIKLLAVLHQQAVRGSISKYAWAEGLRAFHEEELGKVISPFHRLLRDAYHHYVAVMNFIHSRSSLHFRTVENQAGSDHPWEEENLQNMCAACFDHEKYPDDESAAITMDGNLQQKRYKDRSGVEFEELTPKTFVDYKRRDYELAGPVVEDNRDDACDNQFKATKGWNKSELTTLGT